MKLTAMERAIIDWFQSQIADAGIRAQLTDCDVVSRDVTSGGFFAELSTTHPGEPRPSGNIAFSGCGVFAPELENFAHCTLHTTNGRVSSLEVLSVGDGHPLRVSEFEVREVAENFVDLREHDA
jgi:hypothetical protein